MNIYITGIAGFLGSHLADRLIADGHKVFGSDSLIGGDSDNPPCDFRVIDCNNLSDLTGHMGLNNPDVVYHCAATAHEGLSVFSPKVITDNIYGATVGAVTAAIQNKVKRFINMSSMARYGNGDGNGKFTEDMTPRPQDPYGIAKVAAEQTGKLLCEIHGVEWVNLVPHNIIGPRQKYDDPFRNVASIMINRMLQGQQPIIYGDGNQVRCFSPIGDVLDCLVKAMDAPVVGETINIGPDSGEVTINELCRTISDIIGCGFDPLYMRDRPQEVKHATCSSDKARRLLGYEAKGSLRGELERMVNYIREYGTRTFNYHLPLEIVNDKTPRTWVDRII